ncbi:MAG: hypothetical protein WCT12_16860 [Verrucomicrobiota bacterium]|jgi:hypothetical protein
MQNAIHAAKGAWPSIRGRRYYKHAAPNQTYQLEFTPRIVQNTTYWATMSVSSIGGYGGIQQWNSASPSTDHVGLYSIWDSTETTMDAFVFGYNPFIVFNNYTFRFGGEAPLVTVTNTTPG